MRSTSTATALLALALSSALTSAQYLNNNQYGSLPSCADNCPALTQPQSQCGNNDWACFCTNVWTQIQSAPSQICAQTCTNPQDVTQAYQWYTQNCGSDNGATEHPNGGSGNSGSGNNNNNNGGNGGSGTSSSAPSSSSGATSSDSSYGSENVNQSWWDGHWRWIVMVIVLFFGLLGLALFGLWWKRRHQRRQDQITGGFNSGITERAPPMSSNPNVNDSSMLSATNVNDSAMNNGGRDSPVRTRDAYMPYGYGYARSESRLGSNTEIQRTASPLARGQTPVGEVERGESSSGPGAGEATTPSQKKSRRVLVRERSGADSREDVR